MWYYKGDLRFKDGRDEGWTAYSTLENEKLERAWKANKIVVKINDKYKVDLSKMFQFRIDDHDKQRNVKREAISSSSESDSDEPPTKKVKLSPSSLVGQEVNRVGLQYLKGYLII
eukprot:TRINITY_DN6872_c0_g1_i2.p1 TRINITY_DN6872_c0_g1~~TRINITY_DN6872_c0_g1_i2.p1  ORF type:complete len:115 (-),score=20.12 TRINITY_DN6872_c0_g1_i2:395-739(-)